jgi:hypothetical protein
MKFLAIFAFLALFAAVSFADGSDDTASVAVFTCVFLRFCGGLRPEFAVLGVFFVEKTAVFVSKRSDFI